MFLRNGKSTHITETVAGAGLGRRVRVLSAPPSIAGMSSGTAWGVLETSARPVRLDPRDPEGAESGARSKTWEESRFYHRCKWKPLKAYIWGAIGMILVMFPKLLSAAGERTRWAGGRHRPGEKCQPSEGDGLGAGRSQDAVMCTSAKPSGAWRTRRKICSRFQRLHGISATFLKCKVKQTESKRLTHRRLFPT